MANDQLAISVKNVSKSFRLPHEKYTGLKQALINFRPGKNYDELHVLKNVSFDIKKGEFFGIVGRNGSGKSTMLKILAQIYTPEKGGVSITGTLTPFIELGVGFNPELTGRENVYLNGALLGFDRKETAAMYNDIVEFAELHDFMDQKLKNYSSGMQVRLAFSIAIRAKSDILLIDEVLAVGDTAFQQKCFNYFEKLKKNNTTVVLVTHDMSAVRRFCTRAVLIEGGRVVQEGSPSEVASAYTMENLENPGATEDTVKTAAGYKIAGKKLESQSGRLAVEFKYDAPATEDVYVGISVIKDGLSVAEMNTSKQLKQTGPGVATYSLDLAHFNPGVYELGYALFRLANKELIGSGKSTIKFKVEGTIDLTRSGAIKLPDGWKLEAHSGKN
jgi:ABC-2 type transport system ATP-binding protein